MKIVQDWREDTFFVKALLAANERLYRIIEEIQAMYLKHLLSLLLPLFLLGGTNATGEAQPGPVHGTVNILLADPYGLVAETDSMLSSREGQSPYSGRKLYEIDDHTILMIAGSFADSGPRFPDGSYQASSIIKQTAEYFIRTKPKDMSISEQTDQFAELVARQLASVLELNNLMSDRLPGGVAPCFNDVDCTSEITIAGYENGVLKMFHVTVVPTHMSGLDASAPVHKTMEIVTDHLIFGVCGFPYEALSILQHPEQTIQQAPILDRFRAAMASDQGESLTVADLKKLASDLEKRTAAKHPEVGSDEQIAVMERGEITSYQPLSRVDEYTIEQFSNPEISRLHFSEVSINSIGLPPHRGFGNHLGGGIQLENYLLGIAEHVTLHDIIQPVDNIVSLAAPSTIAF